LEAFPNPSKLGFGEAFLEFAWDEQKNASNREKHGLGFELAALLFRAPVLEEDDERQDYGERRVRSYGKVNDRLIVCVYNDRRIDGRPVRWIISLRKANQREMRKFDDKTKALGKTPDRH
jgi:uncharacterized DUF497 family protein